MQIYDIFMLVILVGTALFGAWKGMAWQIASLASFVLSYLVAYRFSDGLAPYLSAQNPWNKFLAMLVLYLGTSLAVWLVFRMVANTIERVKLREFDRQIGGLFGTIKGTLFCVVVTFFAVTLSDQSRELVLESRSGYYISALLDRATPVMPDEIHQVLRPYLDRLERGLDPNTPTEVVRDPRVTRF